MNFYTSDFLFTKKCSAPWWGWEKEWERMEPMNMCHCTMENPYYNSCARNKWANLTFILRQTACVNLLPASCTFCWKNHFGFIIMAVRGASRVIYTFHIYEKKSAPYCAPLRKSLSNFHLNPAHVRGWLNIQNVDPSSEHPRGPSLINGISGYLAGIVTWQWGFFPPPSTSHSSLCSFY